MSTTGATHTDASNAARLLVQRRWGRTRVNTLIHELAQRRDQLGARERAELRVLVDEVDHDDEPPEDAA
jgi:hypothetical protein